MDTHRQHCTQSITMGKRFCLGVLASVLVTGGSDFARAAGIAVDGLQVSANNGQTQAQQQQDLYTCETWASGQTGFDPSISGGGVPPSENAARGSEYGRALSACLEARGYAVRQGAAPRPVVSVALADSPAAPQKWEFVGTYPSSSGVERDNAVIDLTSSYSLEYVVHYLWVGGGFVHQDGQWAPGPGVWAYYNVDIDCTHHTFKARRFINHAGSYPPSDEKWMAIKDSWKPMQLAEKRVCEPFR
jgi:hypothetical protein